MIDDKGQIDYEDGTGEPGVCPYCGGLLSFDDASQFGQKFVDIGLICDNVLEDNILSAIDEVLDSYENIVSEICYAAKDVYGILGGETV